MPAEKWFLNACVDCYLRNAAHKASVMRPDPITREYATARVKAAADEASPHDCAADVVRKVLFVGTARASHADAAVKGDLRTVKQENYPLRFFETRDILCWRMVFSRAGIPLVWDAGNLDESELTDSLTASQLGTCNRVQKCERVLPDESSSDNAKWFLAYVEDCHEPPLYVVRADNAQEAEEVFLNECSHLVKVDDTELAGLIEEEHEKVQYNDDNVACYTDQIMVYEIELKTIEVA